MRMCDRQRLLVKLPSPVRPNWGIAVVVHRCLETCAVIYIRASNLGAPYSTILAHLEEWLLFGTLTPSSFSHMIATLAKYKVNST
jgi:hypothetical protein